ncbi:tryptophan-rich hypothetical protein [Pseudomonas rhodesiae]|nr:tryptophan-rich hypothetical protein [Pseudomonas rhodesiae]
MLELELQAVMTRRGERLPWQTLQDAETWTIGWK